MVQVYLFAVDERFFVVLQWMASRYTVSKLSGQGESAALAIDY